MAPDPIARTVNALAIADSNPNELRIGAIIAAVVIIATVASYKGHPSKLGHQIVKSEFRMHVHRKH